MRRIGQHTVVGAALIAGAVMAAMPAPALEIFGIRLWGRDVEPVEIIDPLPYTVTFRVVTDSEALARTLRTSSALWSDRDTPASGRAGLIAKARGDYRRILAALYTSGYFGPDISILIAGREAADLGLDVELPAEVPVVVHVQPGPRFRFGVAEIVNAPPWREDEDPASVGFEPGRTARAAAVGTASNLAVERWRQLSHARARETDREVIADHATTLLDVTIRIDPDRPARYGPTRVEGSRDVDPDFVAYMADLPEGDRFDPDDIARAQTRLARLGVFRSIRIEEADAVAPDGSLPMTVLVEDRLPRSFGIGATISTLDGLGLEGFALHRNLFGRAEQLRLDASVLGIGEREAPDELTYTLGVSFVKPGVIEPDTNFVTSLVGRQQDFDTYRERSLTGRVGLSRVFGPMITGDLFLEVGRSRVRDDFGTRRFLTVGPYARVQYDRRDDDVDATAGYVILSDFRPFYEAEFGNFAARGTLEGRIYRAVDEDARFVLAGRARVGSFWGPPVAESPPDQLFFAGGGGSIRGFAFRSIGVEGTVAGEPAVVGGRSLVETSGELRARIGERFGAVGFVDAGAVGADSGFGGAEDWRVGAGVGLRYFTGFGPIRLDVAAPVDPRPGDSAVAFYIGIGQAF